MSSCRGCPQSRSTSVVTRLARSRPLRRSPTTQFLQPPAGPTADSAIPAGSRPACSRRRCHTCRMNFARLAEVSAAVAATQSRLEKRRLLAAALREADEDEIDLVATYLSGRVRQRRTGVGWRSLADLPARSEERRVGKECRYRCAEE